MRRLGREAPLDLQVKKKKSQLGNTATGVNSRHGGCTSNKAIQKSFNRYMIVKISGHVATRHLKFQTPVTFKQE